MGKLTESAAEYLGMNTASVESVVQIGWPALPFIAAAGVLYIYHTINGLVAPSPQQNVIVETKKRYPTLKSIGDVLAIVFVGYFVFVVLRAEYSFRPPASDSLRFHNLSQMSNYDLRERAFTVSRQELELSQKYSSRRDEIFAAYNKQAIAWTKQESDYNRSVAENAQWHSKYNYSPYNTTGLLGSGLIGSNPGTSFSGLGQVTQQPERPPEPTILPSPGSKPEPPAVTVDSDWRQKAETTQQEAAAVWEEICHRLGYYPRLYEVPSMYVQNDKLVTEAVRLQNLANDLH